MFWLRNKKNNFQLHTLIWRPASEASDKKPYNNNVFQTNATNANLSFMKSKITTKNMGKKLSLTSFIMLSRLMPTNANLSFLKNKKVMGENHGKSSNFPKIQIKSKT